MSDKIFLDSNVLVYSYSVTEQGKRSVAQQLIAGDNTFISTQVLQELCNIVTRKFEFSYKEAAVAIKECCANNNLYINTEDTILLACQVAQRYNFSFYDCMIIAAALTCDCSLLYSEDMQDGQLIEGKLTIKIHFLTFFHNTVRTYNLFENNTNVHQALRKYK